MKLYDLELSGNCYKVRLFASLIHTPLNIIPVNFTHPKYMHQLNFIPGLSITDALFSVGFDGVRNLITDEV